MMNNNYHIEIIEKDPISSDPITIPINRISEEITMPSAVPEPLIEHKEKSNNIVTILLLVITFLSILTAFISIYRR